MNEKFKKFVKKHKTSIMFTSGVVVGVVAGAFIYKSGKGSIQIPEWVDGWRKHCDDHMLLYENGLPVFANAEQTKIFKDAIVESSIPEFLADGYEIVERGTF